MRKLIAAVAFPALLLLAIAPQSALAQLTLWPVADGGNDHYYEVVPAIGGISWNNASMSATNRGGYLATITSSSENDFVFNLASQQTNIWYGGYGPWLGGIQPAGSPEPGGGWTWITGEPFTFNNWATNQPNNNGGAENRIQFGGLAVPSSAWNDIAPGDTNFTRGFVVEYPKHPNSARMQAILVFSAQLELRWASRSNVVYTIEWAEELPTEVWNTLTTAIGNGTTNTVQTAITQPRRFYRMAAAE